MAACLVGHIPRFGRVSGHVRDVLHRLPYSQRFVYHVSVLVRRCIEGLASPYLWELSCPHMSHCALLHKRSYWSFARGLLSDSTTPSLWLVRDSGMVSRLC